MKLKVLKFCGYKMSFDSYIVDFYRCDGVTRAITIDETGKISDYNIDDLEIDFKNAIE